MGKELIPISVIEYDYKRDYLRDSFFVREHLVPYIFDIFYHSVFAEIFPEYRKAECFKENRKHAQE